MYSRKVQYYETDKMGIVHHSNYIRWMEEARVFFLDTEFIPFRELEAMGLMSPVLSVNCTYGKGYEFGDTFFVEVKMKSIEKARFTIEYTIYDEDEKVTNRGSSEHCFTNEKGRPISLKKVHPDVYEKFIKLVD